MIRFTAVFLLFFAFNFSYAQKSSLRIKKFKYINEKIRLDTLSIYPNSFKLVYKGDTISPNNYRLNFSSSTIELIGKKTFIDTLIAIYRVIPFDLSNSEPDGISFIYFLFIKSQNSINVSTSVAVQGPAHPATKSFLFPKHFIFIEKIGL